MARRPEQRDAYTQEPLPEAPLAPRVPNVEAETGYERTTPNPVYRGLPWFWLVVDERTGDIVAVTGKQASDVTATEHAAKAREIAKRQRNPALPPRQPKRKKNVHRSAPIEVLRARRPK